MSYGLCRRAVRCVACDAVVAEADDLPARLWGQSGRVVDDRYVRQADHRQRIDRHHAVRAVVRRNASVERQFRRRARERDGEKALFVLCVATLFRTVARTLSSIRMPKVPRVICEFSISTGVTSPDVVLARIAPRLQ